MITDKLADYANIKRENNVFFVRMTISVRRCANEMCTRCQTYTFYTDIVSEINSLDLIWITYLKILISELRLLTCFWESQVPRRHIISRVSYCSVTSDSDDVLDYSYDVMQDDVAQAETSKHSESSNIRQRILMNIC